MVTGNGSLTEMIRLTALGLFGPSSFGSAKDIFHFFALRRGITSHHGTGNLTFGVTRTRWPKAQ
jgi:hypothetical protein